MEVVTVNFHVADFHVMFLSDDIRKRFHGSNNIFIHKKLQTVLANEDEMVPKQILGMISVLVSICHLTSPNLYYIL